MLNELFVKYGSDKGDKAPFGVDENNFHAYGEAYEKYFMPMKEKEITMLEIGVSIFGYDAPSLLAWKEFFPRATIVGMDIWDYSMFEEGRVHIVQGDQGKQEDLKAIGDKFGPFDIIIDDGSHEPMHQMLSLAVLFPYLKEDGIYVIEDLHVEGKKSWGTAESTDVLRFFNELIAKNIFKIECFDDYTGTFKIAFIMRNKAKRVSFEPIDRGDDTVQFNLGVYAV